MTNVSPNTVTGEVMVPFERVVALVRHLSHDMRNGLNTLDLQSAFVQELVTDPETLPEVKRLRTMITGNAKTLQALSAGFWVGEPHPVTYGAQMFFEDFRSRLEAALPDQANQIAWTATLADESVSVDLEMIFRAFSEFFRNAFHFREKNRPVSARAFAEGGRFFIEIEENKATVPSSPDTWGMEPLVSTRRGGYGMGLFHARRALAVHGAEVAFHFDPTAEKLVTRLSLPLAEA